MRRGAVEVRFHQDVLGKLRVAGWPHHWLSTFSNHQQHPPFRACVLPKLDAGVNVNARHERR